jgi:hypothetical protein
MVWSYMKRTGTARKPLAKGDSLHDRVDAELKEIQENALSFDLSSEQILSPILVTD